MFFPFHSEFPRLCGLVPQEWEHFEESFLRFDWSNVFGPGDPDKTSRLCDVPVAPGKGSQKKELDLFDPEDGDQASFGSNIFFALGKRGETIGYRGCGGIMGFRFVVLHFTHRLLIVCIAVAAPFVLFVSGTSGWPMFVLLCESKEHSSTSGPCAPVAMRKGNVLKCGRQIGLKLDACFLFAQFFQCGYP